MRTHEQSAGDHRHSDIQDTNCIVQQLIWYIGHGPSVLVLEGCAQHRDLPLDHLPARPSDGLAPLHARLEVEDGLDIICKLLTEPFIVRQRQVVQLTLAGLCERDCATRDVMSFTEWNLDAKRVNHSESVKHINDAYPFADEVVGKVSGEHVHGQCLTHFVAVNLAGISVFKFDGMKKF